MTTLDEAIAHCKEKAKELSDKAYAEWGKSMSEEEAYDCNECAKDHEQLAKWLTELKERREADRWIPVTERMPNDKEEVRVTTKSGKVRQELWNTWYQTEYKDAKDEYLVTAWKPLDKPYKKEGD